MADIKKPGGPIAGEPIGFCKKQMTVEGFVRLAATEMRACRGSYIGVFMPAREETAEWEKDVLKGIVGGVSGLALLLLTRSPNAAKFGLAIASPVVAGFLMRNLPGPAPARMEWIPVEDLLDHD